VTFTYKITQSAIDRYSAGPSVTRTSQVKALHENIRSALETWGDRKYDTFLQGSYRNGTAIKDINDVDIVALYDPWRSPASPGLSAVADVAVG
jgi:tRNA nucleotidyltransferase (CCA-adding enzyme)